MNRDLREFIYGKCDYRICEESFKLLNSKTDEQLKEIALNKFQDSYVDCLFDYYNNRGRYEIETRFNIDTRTFFRRKQQVAEYIAHYFDNIAFKNLGGLYDDYD